MNEPALFVVRVWRSEGFRASVRRVDEDDTRLFGTAAELVRYLEASVVPRPVAGPPARRTPGKPSP